MWIPLFNYEDTYTINHHGDIMNKTGYILKPRHDKDGYLRIGLTRHGKMKEYFVHRLVALTFISNQYNLPIINHKNGVKDDNYVDNLEWCTKRENTLHAMANGLMSFTPPKDNYKYLAHQKGELHPCAKLTLIQVNEIRELSKMGIKAKELALKFNISPRTIRAIVNKERWKES